MGASGRLGRCQGAFWMALLFDMVGLALLLVGFFVDVYFSDLLIYGGGMGLLFSLLWWVFWYVGNLEVPPEELQDDVGLGGKAKAKDSALASLTLQDSLLRALMRSFSSLGPRIPAIIRWSDRATSTTTVSSSSSSSSSLSNHPKEQLA